MYNNLPPIAPDDSPVGQTLKAFNNFGKTSPNIDEQTNDAIIGFFESRGFNNSAAKAITYSLILQSIKDGINPFSLVDTLNGINEVELSRVVTLVLNASRYKSSVLGAGAIPKPPAEVARNLIA